MSSYVNRALDGVAGAVEPKETTFVRTMLKKTASAIQLMSLVALVVSVTSTLFVALLFPPPITVVFAAVALGGSIAFFVDGNRVAPKLEKIAASPRLFVTYSFKGDDQRAEHVRKLAKESAEDTFILRHVIQLFS